MGWTWVDPAGEVPEVPVATSWPKAAEAGTLSELETRQCFHVLGFDVMLTSDGKPHLLEVRARAVRVPTRL